MEQSIENYVDSCYYVETYLKSYNHLLNPIRGSNEWPPAIMTILLPPPTKRIAGMPKKNRRKDPNEELKSKTKSSRKGTPVRCSRCKEYGHNKLGCKKTPVEQTMREQTTSEPPPTAEQVTTQPTPQQSAPQSRLAKLSVKRKEIGSWTKIW